MRRLLSRLPELALGLLISLSLTTAEVAADVADRVAAAEAVVASEAQRLLDAGAASVSVGLLVGNEVVSTIAFGFSNVYTQSRAQPETLYNVASTLKPITATAVMRLVETQRVALDAPVESYLPEYRFRDAEGRPVAVRHLLNHTSALTPVTGMIDLWSRQAPDTLPELAARLTVDARPGDRFAYNNAAFAVAGLLVERIAGQEFEEHLRSEILVPLGIPSHPIRPTPAMVERLALPYQAGEDGHPQPVAWKRIDVFPAGDAYFTAGDLVRLMCVHVNAGRCGSERLLSEGSVAMMHSPGLGDYGLGWGLVPDGDTLLIGHGGGVPGYSAFVLGDPGAHVAVAALATSGDLTRLTRAALNVLRGEAWVPPEERRSVVVAPEILERYVGNYEIQPGVVVRIGLRNGELYVEDPSGSRIEVRASSDETFYLIEAEGTLTFVVEDGVVRVMEIEPGGTARRLD